MELKGILSLCAAIVAAVALVSASGAGTAKVQRTARIDVSTHAGVVKYLRSIHVNPKRVVIQRGARNYAGPRCPGKRWNCTTTTRTVVQIAKGRGKNIFRCTTARCAVVQISKSALAANMGTCIKTTGVTQSCTINQPNASGLNKAMVWMDTGKLTGLTQTALYTASISQGPASAPGSTNTNLACVHQAIFIDGSTNPLNTKAKPSNVTVTNEAHQSILISQNSLTGKNTVKDALQVGTNSYDCGADASALSQSQDLYSLATSKGTVTQKQNAAPNGANLTLDIKQNQGSGFFGNASGDNMASFEQTNNLTAIANAPAGATQTQSSDTTGGILAAVNQDSSGLSTAHAVQEETQCEDAAPSGLTACDHAPDVIPGYSPTQIQFGPAGLANSATGRHGRHFQLRKDLGDSFQTGNTDDVFTVSQTSHQFNDTGSRQKNDVLGGITTDGTGTVTQNTFIQTTPKKNVHQGEGTTVNGNINCHGSSCVKNLSPPTIDSGPPKPDTFGHDASFSFSNVDDSVAFVCSLDGGDYVDCGNPPPSGLGTKSYPNLASGSHTFSVKTRDPDNENLSDAASYTWVITPPDPTITDSPPNPSDSTSASFSFTDLDPTAKFKCQIDGSGYTSCTSPASYTELSAGEHTFDVKATDAATETHDSTGFDTYTWTIALAP